MNFRVLPIATLFLSLVASSSLAGQSASLTKASATLEGPEWTIAQYYLHEELLSPHLQPQWVSQPSIRFQGGIIDGSPGCGQFSGTYKRSGDSLIVAAKWANDAQTPCKAQEKDDATKMVEALGHVRRIGIPPSYWQDDAVLLNDEKGKIQVTLSPKKTGADLSEFHDSFWRPVQIRGSRADFADVIINFGARDISISTPKCIFAFPFDYETAGLKFYPAWERTDAKTCGDDWQLTQVFESDLQAIRSYSEVQGHLTFYDKDHLPTLTLMALRPTTIEDRVWRIAKFLDLTVKAVDTNGLAEAKSRATISLVNGRVQGSPGCGAWVGKYSVSEVQLDLDADAMLAGLCKGEEEAQSNMVVKDFKGSLRIEQVDNDDVLLRDDKGQLRIQLAPF